MNGIVKSELWLNYHELKRFQMNAWLGKNRWMNTWIGQTKEMNEQGWMYERVNRMKRMHDLTGKKDRRNF